MEGQVIVHPNYQDGEITCKNCQGSLKKFGYLCMTCDDYTICNSCGAAGHHAEHLMMRVPMDNQNFTQVKHLLDVRRKTVKEEKAESNSLSFESFTPLSLNDAIQCEANIVDAVNHVPELPLLKSIPDWTSFANDMNYFADKMASFSEQMKIHAVRVTQINDRNSLDVGNIETVSNISTSTDSAETKGKTTKTLSRKERQKALEKAILKKYGMETGWTLVNCDDTSPSSDDSDEVEETNDSRDQCDLDQSDSEFKLNQAVRSMEEMGIQNKKGWLKSLLKACDCSIPEALKLINEET